MRDTDTAKVFRDELARCNCYKCRLLVGAIFAVWDEPDIRSLAMDTYVAHCGICFYHRYMAHQDG